MENAIDSGGELADLGKSVGRDLLDSAKLDLFPMPHTCLTFGVLENPSVLTALRLRADDAGVTADLLDEIAKSASPQSELLKILGLA